MQAGIINDLKDLVSQRRIGAEIFTPTLDLLARQKWRSNWDEAVKRSLKWHE